MNRVLLILIVSIISISSYAQKGDKLRLKAVAVSPTEYELKEKQEFVGLKKGQEYEFNFLVSDLEGSFYVEGADSEILIDSEGLQQVVFKATSYTQVFNISYRGVDRTKARLTQMHLADYVPASADHDEQEDQKLAASASGASEDSHIIDTREIGVLEVRRDIGPRSLDNIIFKEGRYLSLREKYLNDVPILSLTLRVTASSDDLRTKKKAEEAFQVRNIASKLGELEGVVVDVVFARGHTNSVAIIGEIPMDVVIDRSK